MASETQTRLAFIVTEEGFEPDVMEALKQLGLNHFTRWTNCTGSGETGIREGTAVWPGLNSVIMVLMDAALVEPLWERLVAARDDFTITPGVKMFVTDAVMM
ncbi:MAG: hypothetical protein HPY69_15170 [Armatimonadetes bacterium]|nr:hypothetical protein [Armatimonadota bacterium]